MRFTGGRCEGNSKGNAIWEEGDGGSGEWLWKIEEGCGMWIGVAEESNFGPGYQLKVFIVIKCCSKFLCRVCSMGVLATSLTDHL